MQLSRRTPTPGLSGLLPKLVGTSVLTVMLALAGCGGGGEEATRGKTVGEAATTATFSKADVDASVAALPGLVDLVGAKARCGTTLHKLVYNTLAPNGLATKASMGVLLPSGCSGPYPVVLYHHGTQLLKSFAMSAPTNLETFLVNAYFASQGYVVMMPDYLGYGDSTLAFHPYLDAQSMGDVAIDAVRAGRALLKTRNLAENGRLFLTGYSQGGHATMATQRLMERDYAGEFSITASAPMAGFYSLTSTFLDALDTPTDFASVLFAYGLTGMQKSYGDVYSTPSEAFRAPWAATVESLFPGKLDLPDLLSQGQLPVAITGSGGLLTDGIVTTMKTNVNSGVRRRLGQNDLIEWTPKAPLTMCHGARDTLVPVKNMTLAAASFARRGAPAAAVDIEQIPAFKAAIDAQVAAAGTLQVYHAQIAPPLCFSVVKNQVFDPLR